MGGVCRRFCAPLCAVFLVVVGSTASAAGGGWPGYAVATAHREATRIGMAILAAGGNAMDAAVAVSLALGVAEPYSSGPGGGGFWLVYSADEERFTVVDGRETAPSAATEGIYLAAAGGVTGSSVDGPLAAAIPGEVAALLFIHDRWGSVPWRELVEPARRLAADGVTTGEKYQRLARFRLEVLRRWAPGFLADGEPPAPGWRHRQPELAAFLQRLAREKSGALYSGPVTRKLAAAVRRLGGIWRGADLASYRVKRRDPLVGEYPGFTVVSVPPPSSGGVALLTMFNILAGFPYARLRPLRQIELQIEAMRRAYRDRAVYLGDPDFTEVPVGLLIDPVYAAGLRASIRLGRAMPSEFLPGVESYAGDGSDTTHFSIVDRFGNIVSATLSINYPFGSGVVLPGTGFLLNDEMDDFSIAPGVPNVYGLVGGKANAVAPGKRPLSSMSPTIAIAGDRIAVLGTPGGSRIISMVFRSLLDFLTGAPPRSWVSLGRIHHQYLPDVVEYEPGALSEEMLRGLRRDGYRLKEAGRTFGDMQAIEVDCGSGRIRAASDPRGEGMSVAVTTAGGPSPLCPRTK